MTNEDLAKQIQTLTETMNVKFDQINTQLSDIRSDHKNLTNIVRDMELRIDKRFAEVDEQFANVNEQFAELKAGQATLRTNIADLRHDIFIEEGSREQVDDTIFEEQKQNYESLDRRLRLVEAKFPDLAQKTATIA